MHVLSHTFLSGLAWKLLRLKFKTISPNKMGSLFVSFMHLVVCSFCPLEGAGSLPWQGSCASKPGKPKGNKKCSSRQKFDVSPPSYFHLGLDMFMLATILLKLFPQIYIL